MLGTILQFVAPVAVAIIAAAAGLFRGPKTRRRDSIAKDVETLTALPDGSAKTELAALIAFEVQRLQQLEGYITEAQVQHPPDTDKLRAARRAARREQRTSLGAVAVGALGAVGVIYAFVYDGPAPWNDPAQLLALGAILVGTVLLGMLGVRR